MPDSSELLAVARLLSDPGGAAPPSDAQLRRAVSTAYYALFHKVVRAAAERFLGTGHANGAGFSLLYRGFDHNKMKAACLALRVSTLSDRYKGLLRRTAVSQEMRDFAGAFPDLQERRHHADYDPAVQFLISDVASLIDLAEFAIDAFDRTAPDERADVLALMMVGARN